MNMMIETLGMVGNHHVVWAAVAVLALMAVYTLIEWRQCPHLRRTANSTAAEIKAAREETFALGAEFPVLMLGGVVAMLAGLVMISEAIFPQYGFLLVIAGVFLVQTQPAKIRLCEAVKAVVATEGGPEDVRQMAADRLSNQHIWLVSLNFLILLAVTVGLLAF